jgi:hypothetical protein
MATQSTLYCLGQKVEDLTREQLIEALTGLHQDFQDLQADRDRWKRSGDPLRHLLNA